MSVKYNSTKKNVIYSYISLFARTIIGFLILPIIVSSIGKANFGLMRLIYSLTGYIGILDLGLGNAVTRFTALYNTKKKKQKINSIASYSLLVYIFVALIGLMGGIFLFFNFGSIFNLSNDEISIGKIAFSIALLNSLLQLPSITFISLIKGYNKYNFFYASRTIKIILRALTLIILFKLGYGLMGVWAIYAFDEILRGVLAIIHWQKGKWKKKALVK